MSKKREVELVIKARDQAKGTLDKHKGQLDGLKLSHAAIGAAAGAAAVAVIAAAKKSIEAIRGQIQAAADLGDQFDKMSARTGESVENLSKWVFLLERAGGQSSQFEASVRRLSKSIYDYRRGLSTAVEAWGENGLGLDPTQFKTVDEVLWALSDKLKRYETQMEASGMAQDVLGRSASQMVAMLRQPREELERQIGLFRTLGGEMRTEFSRGAAAVIDAETDIKWAMNGMRQELTTPILPVVSEVIDELAVSVGVFAREMAENKDDIARAAESLGEVASAIIEIGSAIATNYERISAFVRIVGFLRNPLAAGAGEIRSASFGEARDHRAAKNRPAGYGVYALDVPPPRPSTPWTTLPSVNQAPLACGYGGAVPDDPALMAAGIEARARREAAELRAEIEEGIKLWDEYADAVDPIIGKMDDIKDAGVSAAQQIGAQFADMFAMMIVQGGKMEDIFGSLLKSALSLGLTMGLKSVLGLPVGFAQGGAVVGAAQGMSVRGGTPGRDSVLVRAQNGEEIINRDVSMQLRSFLTHYAAAQVGPIGGSIGGGAAQITIQESIPGTPAETVRLGRRLKRALEAANEGVL